MVTSVQICLYATTHYLFLGPYTWSLKKKINRKILAVDCGLFSLQINIFLCFFFFFEWADILSIFVQLDSSKSFIDINSYIVKAYPFQLGPNTSPQIEFYVFLAIIVCNILQKLFLVSIFSKPLPAYIQRSGKITRYLMSQLKNH